MYINKEWWVALLEMFIHVDVVSLGMADLLEAVHVELADEGGEVVVFEVSWQHLLCEACDIFDIEAVKCGGPAHSLSELLILG